MNTSVARLLQLKQLPHIDLQVSGLRVMEVGCPVAYFSSCRAHSKSNRYAAYYMIMGGVKRIMDVLTVFFSL
jgi:hypothetical protein